MDRLRPRRGVAARAQLALSLMTGIAGFAAGWALGVAHMGWTMGLLLGWWPAMIVGAAAAWIVGIGLPYLAGRVRAVRKIDAGGLSGRGSSS